MNNSSFYKLVGSCHYFSSPVSGPCIAVFNLFEFGSVEIDMMPVARFQSDKYQPITQAEFEAQRAEVLTKLGLIDVNAPFLALCDAFDAQEEYNMLPF